MVSCWLVGGNMKSWTSDNSDGISQTVRRSRYPSTTTGVPIGAHS